MADLPMLRAAALLTAGALALAPAAAPAQGSSAPIQIVVNFPPGGVTDAVARVLAAEMAPRLHQPVIVQNTPGAGGAIGVAQVAKAANNGHTLGFIAVAALTSLPSLQPVPYRLDSFEYVCQTFDVPVFVLVAPGSRFQTLESLVEFARANPGKLNFATVGPGSLPHLLAVDFAKAAGLSLNHVPYKGEGPAVTDLLGNHVDLYFGTSAVATTHKLRRLAVAAAERVAESPDTPTLSERGYRVTRSIIGGLIAPKGVNATMLSDLRTACAQAVQTAAFRSTLDNLKVRVAYAEGPAFGKAIEQEAAVNRETLRAAGVLPQ